MKSITIEKFILVLAAGFAASIEIAVEPELCAAGTVALVA